MAMLWRASIQERPTIDMSDAMKLPQPGEDPAQIGEEFRVRSDPIKLPFSTLNKFLKDLKSLIHSKKNTEDTQRVSL